MRLKQRDGLPLLVGTPGVVNRPRSPTCQVGLSRRAQQAGQGSTTLCWPWVWVLGLSCWESRGVGGRLARPPRPGGWICLPAAECQPVPSGARGEASGQGGWMGREGS